MRKVELVKGIQSSVLGFGCAPILGSVGSQKAKYALDAAIDNGITHFDLARSYGYGQAEYFVGNYLKLKRNDLVYASKFGIKANFKAKLLIPFKPFLRYGLSKIKKNSPSIARLDEEKTALNIGDKFHYRIPLDKQQMKKSLEESLRALKTDYLDYFFIHEPYHSIENIDELTEYAAQLKKEGKIKAFGLAFMQNQQKLHTDYLNKFDVLQFNNSPGMVNYNNIIAERTKLPNIFFSPLRGGYVDMKPSEKLRILTNDFPQSIILCSMFNEKHLKTNAALFY